MLIVFWISLLILIYIYFGYYISLIFINKKYKSLVKMDDNYFPSVSLIISSYNEEDVIEKKILNSLRLDYPREKLEIIISDDGSTDSTVNIASKYPVVKILNYKQNEGKTQTQNKTVKHAKGEILIFSDANAMYERDAVKKLVRNFYDSNVGCVCGELKYKKSGDNGAGDGEGLYWRYERTLKIKESSIFSTLGANGSIYSLRKELYVPLPPDIISDFVEPLMIVKNGKKSIYEPEAISVEIAEGDYKKEFKRKVRIITRSIRGFVYSRDLIKFNLMGFMLISHKLLRWLSPIFMITLFLSNFFINNNLYYLLFLMFQILFYFFAAIGIKYKSKILYISSYFVMVNYAALLGIIKAINGERYTTWNTSHRN